MRQIDGEENHDVGRNKTRFAGRGNKSVEGSARHLGHTFRLRNSNTYLDVNKMESKIPQTNAYPGLRSRYIRLHAALDLRGGQLVDLVEDEFRSLRAARSGRATRNKKADARRKTLQRWDSGT